MREIGLYYPFFHVRDDAWLKAAALYLPRIARLRPPGYPMGDSRTASVLRDELDFLQDIDPGQQATAVAGEFEALIDREGDRILELYGIGQTSQRIPTQMMIEDGFQWWQPDHEGAFAWIHASQLGVPAHIDLWEWEKAHATYIGMPSSNPLIRLIPRIHELGLARAGGRINPFTGRRDDNFLWVGMHPHMVSVYSCALAARIAQANSLTPVTDDPRFFLLPDLWTADDLGAALLQDAPPGGSSPASGRASVLYACAAVQAVLPSGIERVPVEKIIHARKVLSDEFDAFSAHIEALHEEFSLLDGIEDPGILQAQLESMVERNLTKPTRELECGLRTLGMDPVRGVFGLKSLELPAVAALAAHTMHMAPIAGAGGAIAIQLLSSVRTAQRTSAAQRKSAAGYLLGLRRDLDPATALTRARRTLFGGS
ncbi:DUF6236 family protein [Streptomyces sp. NPDC101133]|uniref:DUF6236 family protein n=1 Tax=Streptomyces sp. NPDC101133 TaxID=3366111 RepID=UPI0038185E31